MLVPFKDIRRSLPRMTTRLNQELLMLEPVLPMSVKIMQLQVSIFTILKLTSAAKSLSISSQLPKRRLQQRNEKIIHPSQRQLLRKQLKTL